MRECSSPWSNTGLRQCSHLQEMKRQRVILTAMRSTLKKIINSIREPSDNIGNHHHWSLCLVFPWVLLTLERLAWARSFTTASKQAVDAALTGELADAHTVHELQESRPWPQEKAEDTRLLPYQHNCLSKTWQKLFCDCNGTNLIFTRGYSTESPLSLSQDA